VGLIAFALAGCGDDVPSSAGPDAVSDHGHASSLAHRCDEPKSVMAAQLDAALKALDLQGLHGSRAEPTEAFNTVVAYAATRERSVDCTRLLATFVATFKERARHTTITERARGGLFSDGPTSRTARFARSRRARRHPGRLNG
jgi:hypothetical protein